MRTAAFWISMLALVATVAPALAFFAGRIDLDQTKLALNLAMLAWFVATPFWMGREPEPDRPTGD